ELQLEARARLLQPGERVACVHRETDRATRVRDATGDRLTDPPRRVRRELEALAPVELLDGVHQAEVALLDEVEQRQAGRLVLLRDRHDQTEVRLHERALGVFAVTRAASQFALLRGRQTLGGSEQALARSVAILDGLSEPNFIVLGEQWVLPDVREIEP